MTKNSQSGFEYEYSAPTENERKEIESIRRNYQEKSYEQNKFERLRKLDSMAKKLPKMVSLTLGIISILIFGLGMSTIMVWDILVLGVILSVVGILGMALAYPIYHRLFVYSKKKFGKEILFLSEELLNEDK